MMRDSEVLWGNMQSLKWCNKKYSRKGVGKCGRKTCRITKTVRSVRRYDQGIMRYYEEIIRHVRHALGWKMREKKNMSKSAKE